MIRKSLPTVANRLVLIVVLVLILNLVANAGDQRPNIVLIMADDLGFETLGCYGGTSYQTPNLDALAKSGIRFNHCYSTPKCTPSRVNILTGRYGFRTGQEWGYIPPDEITFGHVLYAAGYATALAGKWQLCLLKENPMHIRQMGFDQSCVFGWHEGPRYYHPLIYENGKIRNDVEDRYGPDVYCEFLIDFIEQNKDKPFLAYYPMTLAHDISNDFTPYPPTGPGGRYESYKEMVEHMDKIVGRIVDALERLKIREKTLILFTGDNGSPIASIIRIENDEFIREPIFSKMGDKVIPGGKGKLTDGGTHVPLIANWPGTAPEGAICDDLIDFSDFLPTFAELVNAELPQNVIIDGKSFSPQLRGQEGDPRKWIYTEFEGKAWVRNKRWKLYRHGSLYDIETDPFEKTPITPEMDSEESIDVRENLRVILNILK
jgi:arylsulfatase A